MYEPLYVPETKNVLKLLSELQEARSAIAQLGGAVEDVTDYTIPGTEVTHRVVRIRKERPTPAGFPRAFARIKKAPLR